MSTIRVTGSTQRFGSRTIFRDVSFEVAEREVFVILGGSGCGKSTLLNQLIGLLPPTAGEIEVLGHITTGPKGAAGRRAMQRQIGVMFQSGALFGSMTLLENIMLPLEMFTDLPTDGREAVARMKLGLVGLGHATALMPAEISGGMAKRAGIARAMALDPPLLFLDEPSAGLDPITSAELDKLILDLRDDLGTTFVVVTHELQSILAIADRCIMLDRNAYADGGGMIAEGNPRTLRDEGTHKMVRAFFRREILRHEGVHIMEGRATYLRVGLLIVAGAGLLSGLVWFLGGTSIKGGTVYESYFGELVQGLEIGVAVRYRGVAVGRVTAIGLVTAEYGASNDTKVDPATYRLVFVRYLVDPKLLGRVPDTASAVKSGLRSRLASAGLTGVTYIELDFVNPLRNPAAAIPWKPEGEYIPSVPTTLSQVEDATKLLIEKLNRIDIVALSDNANRLMIDVDKLVTQATGQIQASDLPSLVTELKQTSASLRKLAENPDIGRTLTGTAVATEKLTQLIGQLPPLIASVQAVTKRADAGVADTQQALVPLLRDILATTANLKDITDSLRRDPAQVLVGQPPPRQTGGGR